MGQGREESGKLNCRKLMGRVEWLQMPPLDGAQHLGTISVRPQMWNPLFSLACRIRRSSKKGCSLVILHTLLDICCCICLHRAPHVAPRAASMHLSHLVILGSPLFSLLYVYLVTLLEVLIDNICQSSNSIHRHPHTPQWQCHCCSRLDVCYAFPS